ncbi:hypothetical protein [Enterocloster clostridioformis]|uniref:Uncharacterized protein n=1 Tax=[Clostridium] clostridioforme 90A8 TaxID=999408 RepID=A0A0E2H9B5_9FIRM|nr:hypothetical protein [Enterocloster clostridioformis]ENZ13224.1 hypothetical protein HMPREF1090_02957 [[Clostridium] clostridioforme 90A8]
MFGFGKKKVDKVGWAAVVFSEPPKNPEKLSEEQLSALTTGLLMQHARIINDSVRLVQTTKNPETRQGRSEFCHKHHAEMMKLKPFCDKEQLTMIQDAEEAMRGVKLL